MTVSSDFRWLETFRILLSRLTFRGQIRQLLNGTGIYKKNRHRMVNEAMPAFKEKGLSGLRIVGEAADAWGARADVALDLEFLTKRWTVEYSMGIKRMVAADFVFYGHNTVDGFVRASGLHCGGLKMVDRNRFLRSCGRRKSLAGFHLKLVLSHWQRWK